MISVKVPMIMKMINFYYEFVYKNPVFEKFGKAINRLENKVASLQYDADTNIAEI